MAFRILLVAIIATATASCSFLRSRQAPDSMSASAGATAPLPAPKLAAKREIYETDCSKPVAFDEGQGNLRCK